MSLSLNYINLLSRTSNNNIIGLIFFFFANIYNSVSNFFQFFSRHFHPSKILDNNLIQPSVLISSWSVKILNSVKIEEKTIIKPGTIIFSYSSIGRECVIGDDGFQVLRYKKKRIELLHTGKVIIGEHSCIGSRTNIDRGLFGGLTSIGSYTHVGSGTIVGHNIQIGSRCYIGDNVAIGGKTKIGDNVIIGDRVSISNRIIIASNSRIESDSIITKNIH